MSFEKLKRKAWSRFFAGFALLSLLLGAGAGAQTPANVPGKTAPTTPEPQTPEAGKKPAANQGVPAGISGGKEDQLFLEVRVGTNDTKITPDLRDAQGRPQRSFLTPGSNTVADFTYFQDHSFAGSNRVQVLSIFRNSNDPRVDPEANSYQRGYIRLTTPNWEWNFGDYLVPYSRLTYRQNIKGAHVVRKFDHGFRVMANGGVFTDRWGSIFKDYLVGKPFTRIVAGLRAEENLSRDKVIAFNFAHGRDLPDSIRPDLLATSGFLPVDNQIVSLDSRMNLFRVLSLDGEVAYSWTDPNTLRPVAERAKRKDYAVRFDTSYRQGPVFLRTSFTRLMPDFLSINARQLADLQDTGFRGGLDFNRHITLEAAFRHTTNNLRDNRPEGSTVFKVPEVRLSFREIPGLGRTILDVGYRERLQDGPFLQSLGGRENRETRIPFVEYSIPISSTIVSGSYEHRGNVDHNAPGQNSSTNRVAISVRSMLGLGGWEFSPLFRYEIERELFLRVQGANNNRTIQAMAILEAPRYFVFEGMYRQIGATLFSECLTTPSEFCQQFVRVPPGAVVLLPSGFGRPAYRAAITYKIANSDDRFIVFSFDRNDNYFALPGRNFRERVIAVTFVFRWKR